MSGLTVLTPMGCIGNRGMQPEAFLEALDRWNPQAIAVDAGSFDLEPSYALPAGVTVRLVDTLVASPVV